MATNFKFQAEGLALQRFQALQLRSDSRILCMTLMTHVQKVRLQKQGRPFRNAEMTAMYFNVLSNRAFMHVHSIIFNIFETRCFEHV